MDPILPLSADCETLHQRALQMARHHSDSRYELIHCLAELEARNVHRVKGCGTAAEYAVRHLDLTGDQAALYLRAGRILRRMPRVDAAFRDGLLGWSRLREIVPVLTEENEVQVLEFALRHTVREIFAWTTMTMEQWRREQSRPLPTRTSDLETTLPLFGSAEEPTAPREDGGLPPEGLASAPPTVAPERAAEGDSRPPRQATTAEKAALEVESIGDRLSTADVEISGS